ncbi:MAG TPA: hypothetical protein VF459_02795 [Caulobacteraceae bacterium]
MSRTVRATARRRISLLATSSLVASTIIAGAGGVALTAFTPAVALAATCTQTEGTYAAPNASTGGTITCGPGSVASIGFTSPTAGTDILMQGNLVVNNGGLLLTSTGAFNLGVAVTPGFTGGSIDATGAGEDGIHVASTGGNVQVSNAVPGSAITVIGDVNGIFAGTTLGGTVDVTAAANVTGGAQAGIQTSAGTGATTVTVNSGVTVTATSIGAFGIWSNSASGNITLNQNGTVGQGIALSTGGAGVVTANLAGNVSNAGPASAVNLSGDTVIFNQTAGAITETGGGDGVNILAGASGVSLSSAVGTSISSTTGNGLTVASSGVVAGTLNGNIKGSLDGIAINSTGGANLVTLTTNGTVTGVAGDGINIASVGGINLTTNGAVSGDPGVVLGDNSASGITYVANSTVTGTAGGIISTEAGTGATSITANAAVKGGAGGAGIAATNSNAIDGSVAVIANANVSGTAGITATTHGFSTTATSTVTVNNGITVTATNGVGIEALSADTFDGGAATVNLNGVVSVNATNGDGVRAENDGDSNSTVTMTGAGGAIVVAGGNGLHGVAAISNDGNSGGAAGSAFVTTNTGLGVTVGAAGGNNDIGVLATSQDTSGGTAQVTLGGTNTITVGSAGATGTVGVEANVASIFSPGTALGAALITGGSGDVIHVLGDGAIGVSATSEKGAATVNGFTGGSITVTDGVGGTGNSVGVLATTAGAGAATVDLGTTSVTNNDGIGIDVLAVNGAASATTAGNVSTTNGAGINVVTTGNGAVSATVNGTAHVAATNGAGVNATTTGTGGVTVTTASGTVVEAVTAGLNSINAISTGTAGDVTVNANGRVGDQFTYAGKNAIDAEVQNAAGTGNVLVNLEGGPQYNSAGNDLIFAKTTGLGSVTVNLNDTASGQSFAGRDGIDAIIANAANTQDVTVTLGNAAGTSIADLNASGVGTGAGILATTNGLGNVTVTENVGSSIGAFNAPTGPGIDASVTNALGGNLTVTANGSITSGAQGVLAQSASAGDIQIVGTNPASSITAGLAGISAVHSGLVGGNVLVDYQGTILAGTDGVIATVAGAGTVTVNTTGSVTGTASTGITATSAGGSVSVTTNQTLATDAVTGALDGILATSTGANSTTVTANSIVTANGDLTVNSNTGAVGVSAASGSGGVTVNVNNVVNSTGRGVVTSTTDSGAITVASTGAIHGLGDATHALVDITTGTLIVPSSTTTLTNAGLISSNSGTLAAQAADLAVTAVGGDLVVVNSGTLDGRIDASGLTSVAGPPATTFFAAITNSGTWNTGGASTLSGGADSITNTAAGTINTAGTTTIAFGAGADSLTNAGLIKVGGAGAATAAASLSLTGLETFANSGVIDLHDGVSPANRSLTASGTAFTGSGGSQLYVDAFLGAAGSTADTLTIGSSAGVTAIRVNDTNTGPGQYNPTGILVVTGSSAANTFTLSSLSSGYTASGIPSLGVPAGALNKAGLFFYDLAFSGNQELLISAPKTPALQFAQIGAISGDTWYTTTQTWFDRQADLRDSLDGRATGSQPAVWMKIVGDWGRRDSSETLTILNKTYTYDTSYRGNTAAVIAGVDLLNVTDKNKAWVVGVQGGYVDTNERFRNSATRLNLTGGVVGVYATYLQGGLFVDGIINGNILTGAWNIPNLGVTAAPWLASSHVNTWGGQLEAGYAFPVGASSFVEPLGSIAYGRTTTGALTLPGATEAFGNSDTLRGSLGGRVGTTAAFQYYKVKMALEGRVWDEFDGKTNTVLSAGGLFSNGNDINGVYGEIKGEANLFAAGNNLSAFVNTGVKWKSRYQDTTVTLGVRYQW